MTNSKIYEYDSNKGKARIKVKSGFIKIAKLVAGFNFVKLGKYSMSLDINNEFDYNDNNSTSNIDIINKISESRDFKYETLEDTILYKVPDNKSLDYIINVTHNSKTQILYLNNDSIIKSIDGIYVLPDELKVYKAKKLDGFERTILAYKYYFEKFIPKTDAYKYYLSNNNVKYKKLFGGCNSKTKEVIYKDAPYIEALNILKDYYDGNINKVSKINMCNLLNDCYKQFIYQYNLIGNKKLPITDFDFFKKTILNEM